MRTFLAALRGTCSNSASGIGVAMLATLFMCLLPIAACALQDDGDEAAPEAVSAWSSSEMLDAGDVVPPVEEDPAAPEQPKLQEGQSGIQDSLDKGGSPFSLQSSGDPRSVPLKYGGKLFMTQPDGKNYSCSAQFVAPRVVLTAAHCVRDADTGEWYTNIVFALQYEDGKYSHQYRTVCKFTKRAWIKKNPSDKKDYRYDYAMLVVDADSTAGFFGWAFGYNPENKHAVKIGYPGKIERGRVIQMEEGTMYRYRSGLVALRHNNPLNSRGSSGGAFVGNFSNHATPGSNHVLSVASHIPVNDPTLAIGPYFDEQFKSMLDTAMRGC